MKFFILYILRQLSMPTGADDIAAIAMIDGLVGYFACIEALDGLVNTGHVRKTTGEAPLFTLSKLGESDLASYETSLPPSIRKEAAAAAVRTTARLRAEAGVRCELIVKGENHFVQRCVMLDGEDEIMRLELLVTNLKQAAMLETNFKKNASEIYNRVIEAAIGDYEGKKED